MSETTRIEVGDQYDVLVGHGLLEQVAPMLGSGVERVLVVHSCATRAAGERLAAQLRTGGYATGCTSVPDGEGAKTVQVLAGLWQTLGRRGLTRSDAVVGVGGGAVTDLAGFAAATWLRGVRVVQVPTTLLGMVDAAVGGKNGINTSEGKNLVGAFHPPAGVICDLDLLAGLPLAELRSGLAEVVKCGFVADPVILELVRADPDGAHAPGNPVMRELVERSVRVKAQVVAADLTETGLREVLNYGHTFGHAVEQVEAYTRRHGEAVAIGMVYVAELAASTGHLAVPAVELHRTVLRLLGLPTAYRQDRWEQLYAAMRRDKKSRGAMLRFVVLDDIGQPARLEGPSEQVLLAAYRRLAR